MIKHKKIISQLLFTFMIAASLLMLSGFKAEASTSCTQNYSRVLNYQYQYLIPYGSHTNYYNDSRTNYYIRYNGKLYPIQWQESVPTVPTVPTTPATPDTSDTSKPDTSTTPTSGLTAEEQQMVNLVNQERVKVGLQPLEVDMRLVKVARMKSQDMIDNNYFSHQSPTYGSPFDMMKAQGISYGYAGENLAGNQSVQAAHTSLMNSSGHRANILNTNFKHVGIGIVHGGPYGIMFTQEFTD